MTTKLMDLQEKVLQTQEEEEKIGKKLTELRRECKKLMKEENKVIKFVVSKYLPEVIEVCNSQWFYVSDLVSGQAPRKDHPEFKMTLKVSRGDEWKAIVIVRIYDGDFQFQPVCSDDAYKGDIRIIHDKLNELVDSHRWEVKVNE